MIIFPVNKMIPPKFQICLLTPKIKFKFIDKIIGEFYPIRNIKIIIIKSIIYNNNLIRYNFYKIQNN